LTRRKRLEDGGVEYKNKLRITQKGVKITERKIIKTKRPNFLKFGLFGIFLKS
jgi:hypothetical protein